ncbi:GD18860 [Drosophila simulans]|uniref:GD18860 n=1 Tax=Drosophila simulans TaxID=7240 RepID=B4QS60_DROSI|nr:GD18860 [Drosophila simulans]
MLSTTEMEMTRPRLETRDSWCKIMLAPKWVSSPDGGIMPPDPPKIARLYPRKFCCLRKMTKEPSDEEEEEE